MRGFWESRALVITTDRRSEKLKDLQCGKQGKEEEEEGDDGVMWMWMWMCAYARAICIST